METQPTTQKSELTALAEEEKRARDHADRLYAKISSIVTELSSTPSSLKPVLVETRIGNDGKPTKHRYRPFVSDNTLCVFNKRKKKWGDIFRACSHTTNIELSYPASKKTAAERWQDSWIRVAEYLRESGLWQDMLADVETALDIGYEKLQQAHKAYWNQNPSITYDKQDEAIASIDSRLIVNGFARTSIIWYMTCNAKVKKMYFGKRYNKMKLAEIARCMKAGQECEVHQRVSYDVSFNYDPKLKKAWYREEFRGCGNGHYYLALNETHALFYEDD